MHNSRIRGSRLLGSSLIAVLALTGTSSYGQTSVTATVPLPAVSRDEAARISSGWALLNSGRYQEAAAYAESVLAQFPRSPSALALAIEAVIAGRGAYASLDTYERWLGSRTQEEPATLARIGRAVLHEWARQTTDPTARIEALKVLSTDGLAEATAVLTAGADAGGVAETRALIALGNARAIDRALGQLKSAQGLKVNEIMTLGESRSPRVLKPLVDLLRDERRENRSEAAVALGKIGRPDAIPPLKALLDDPNGAVRISAAGSLLQLGDLSGLAMIRELAGSEHAAVRRTAAVLLASLPDEEWKALVRGLASSPDPSFRLDAARLMAPHDEAFSKSLLEGLLLDPNPAIRDQAGVMLARATMLADFPALRRLLRAQSGRVRVAAAERLLKAVR